MIIDCAGCAAAGPACEDCVVTVLLGPPPAVNGTHERDFVHEVADEHAAALRVLAESGLVPPLRLVPRSAAS